MEESITGYIVTFQGPSPVSPKSSQGDGEQQRCGPFVPRGPVAVQFFTEHSIAQAQHVTIHGTVGSEIK